MPLEIDVRPSDSPLVDSVWRGLSLGDGRVNSIASSHWHLVVSEFGGEVDVSVHGPETRPVALPLPPEATWVGIRFRLGVVLHDLPVRDLVDGGVVLPGAGSRTFWWKGGAWERPSFDNAESLVERLMREDLIGRDPLVHDAVLGRDADVSARTVQRRFTRTTGLTHGAVRRIEQARRSAVLLREGVRPADVAHELGYYDQPHLTRATRRYLGRTPVELSRSDPAEQLSLLYKTDPSGAPTLTFDRLGGPTKAA